MSLCISLFRKVLPSLTLKQLVRHISFVPKCEPFEEEDYHKIKSFINKYDNILVITGAGVSTESGIPDYRSEEVGLFARSNHKPIQYQEFLKSSHIRKRYWARNFIGWPKFSQSQPNVTHHTLAFLETIGKVSHVITQNVDYLHTKACTKNVIELHGSAFRVMCLRCDNIISRHDLQIRLTELNPNMRLTSQMVRPDGDVEISQEQIGDFVVPPCENCSGILKPDIIFFGDNIPRARGMKVRQAVTDSSALLILGSSLYTYSGYRIVLQAKEEGKEVGMVNIGPTRADPVVDWKIAAKCGDLIGKLYQEM